MAYPDTVGAVFVDQYASVVSVDSAGTGIAFGFMAKHIEVTNDGPVRVFMDLGSTGAASTSDMPVNAGESKVLRLIGTAGLGLRTTSTSTSDSATPSVRVLALGG